MEHRKYFILNIYFYLVALVLFSCRKNVDTKPMIIDRKKGVEVIIQHPAGDRWGQYDDFLPLPFNIATTRSHTFIVLSDRIKSGKKVRVNPLGAIRFTYRDTLKTFIIAAPSDKKHFTMNVDDFDELVTVYSPAKQMIENYVLHRSMAAQKQLYSWEDDNFAINYLLK